MQNETQQSEEIHLVLPARPELMEVARLTAARLAGTLDFALNEIEDLKIAVDELSHQLLSATSSNSSVRLTYTMAVDVIEVTGTSLGPENDTQAKEPVSSHPLTNRILEAVTDSYSVDVEHHQVRFSMTKRRAIR